MLETPAIVDIHTEDNKNIQAIMKEIRTKNLTNEDDIRTLVEGYAFSSPETQQHIADRLVDLLKMGSFDQPELEGITMNLISIPTLISRV
ncbi:MAG: hypothetical protein ABII07_00735 [Patescibacteria group bacterium]|nr:hypothetical protein [Patescibacteria group bacterium]